MPDGGAIKPSIQRCYWALSDGGANKAFHTEGMSLKLTLWKGHPLGGDGNKASHTEVPLGLGEMRLNVASEVAI